MRLPRSMRITRRSDFQRVRKEGTAFAGKFIVLSVLPDNELPVPFQFGIILTRKVGNAVTRNKIRRRLKAVFSELGSLIIPGHLIVIIGRYRAANADFQNLREDWKLLAHKAGILQDAAPASS